MKVFKILNNSAVGSYDENNQEIILLGKGIGFQKKVGEFIDKKSVEQIYVLPTNKREQYVRLVNEIPYEILTHADTIISKATKRLSRKLNDNIYIYRGLKNKYFLFGSDRNFTWIFRNSCIY
ncbi:MAG: hypothetical protein GXY98_04105 [Erysipelothrix sp.]|nr:hypothetical protein [Erysipelothrix sp.]